ncbi:MAG: hypothetical protein FWF45_06665 [Coriobacteriia bacterium]|nr:hypothetical protein [Coriobacteriia bacterium]
MKISSKRALSLLLTFAMVCTMTVGFATSAFAATTNINAPGDWATYAPGNAITLNNGDILNIGTGAGSPAAETVINIAANANVTINGNNSLITNLSIAESAADTTSHTVTINNLKIQTTGLTTYTMYRGTLVLEGTNEFHAVGSTYAVSNGHGLRGTGSMPAVNITSSTGGSLTIDAKLIGIWGGNTCTISGNAQVTSTGRSGAAIDVSLTIGSDASLTATSTYATLSGIQNVTPGNIPTIYNSGTLVVTAGAGAQAIYSNDIYMAEGATTTLTNMMTSFEGHVFYRMSTVPAGYIWELTGTAAFYTSSDTPDSQPASIIVPAGTTGTIRLVLPATQEPPTITGPTAQTVTEGYAATSSDVFTVTGTDPVTVSVVSGDPAITWNPTTMKLDIAPGLAPGTYQVRLKATNGIDPDAYADFELTVETAPVNPIPPTITGPTAQTVMKGYAATSTDVFTVTGTAPVTVTVVSGNPAITWNPTTMKLDIAPGLAPGTYVVKLKASNGVDPDAYATFTLTVKEPYVPPKPPALVPPTITGPTALTIKKGYKKTLVGPFTVKGTKPVKVIKVSGNPAITWNDKTKTLDIAPGLAPGTYVVVLKASNGVDPDAYLTFTLTVTASSVKVVTSPLSLPATGDSGRQITGLMLGIAAVFGLGAFALVDKRHLAWLRIME